jgi:hypothetical protein
MYVPAVEAELSGEIRYSSSFDRCTESVRNARKPPKSGFGALYVCGDATGVPPAELPSKGVRRTFVVSKSSGRARDLSILSRSLVVRRFSFARLVGKSFVRKETETELRKELTCFETTLGPDAASSRESLATDGLDEQRLDALAE